MSGNATTSMYACMHTIVVTRTCAPAGPERYEKVRLLGKGSFGKVWIVREKGSPTQWVMKEIRPQNKQELQEAVCVAGIWTEWMHVG
jgi:hypothetical protein